MPMVEVSNGGTLSVDIAFASTSSGGNIVGVSRTMQSIDGGYKFQISGSTGSNYTGVRTGSVVYMTITMQDSYRLKITTTQNAAPCNSYINSGGTQIYTGTRASGTWTSDIGIRPAETITVGFAVSNVSSMSLTITVEITQ